MSENSMTLTSLAMLKVNADRVNRDYMDYLLPFVEEVLSQDTSPAISDRAVQQAIQAQFGLNIPTAGIQFVLRRLAKRGYLRRDQGVFIKAKELPERDIAGRQAIATRQITQVVTHLEQFVTSRFSVAWTTEQATAAILGFFGKFSVQCLKCYIQGTALPDVPKSSTASLYIVGSWIKEVSESNLPLFDSIMVLLKGQLLANALICSDIESLQRDFRDLTILFDTPLLLRLLGGQGDEEQEKCQELLTLVQRLGARTAAFEHTFAEVDRVLRSCERYVDNPQGRGRMIKEMRRQGKTGSDIALLRSRAPTRFGSLGIIRVKTPSYDPKFQIDEIVLQDTLDEDIDYHNERAIQDDVNSIRSIYALRRGLYPVRLEDAKAVLVTSNAALARTAFEYGSQYECLREVSSVVTDFSLANIAWLKAPLDAPALPATQLLSMCYAALEPREELWGRYVKEVDRLATQGDITPHDHKLLRYSLRAQEELMHMTLGNEQAISVSTVTGILDAVKADLTGQRDSQIANERARGAVLLQERDEERDRVQRVLESIFAASARAGRIGARAVVSGLAVALGLALVVTTFHFVGKSAIGEWTAGGLAVVAIIFGFANWVWGVSVFGLGRILEDGISRWSQNLLLRWSVSVKESPAAIAGQSPLPDLVARRHESNRQDRWRGRVAARTSR